eukprot:394683-Prorocentrum_minimum.AAC.1
MALCRHSSPLFIAQVFKAAMVPVAMSMVMIRHPRGLVAFSTVANLLIFGTIFAILAIVTPHLNGDLYDEGEPLKMFGSVQRCVAQASPFPALRAAC